MEDNLEKWERQIGLLSLLLKQTVPITREQIELSAEGYGPPHDPNTTRKRLQRDMDELKELGVAIEYRTAAQAESTGEQGYCIDRARTFLPNIEITDRENVLLNLLSRSIDRPEVSPIARCLRTALLKLQCSSGLGGSSDADLEEKILIHKQLGAREAPANLAHGFQAVSECRTATFEYRSPGNADKARRTVDGYGLGFHSAAWYLVGHCHARNEVRVFKLSRIDGRIALGERSAFSVPDDFSIDDHVGVASWQIGSDPMTATIRFDAEVAWMIANNVRTDDRFELHDDGTGLLTTDVSNPKSLVRWVLKFKHHAHVVGPPILVEKMVGELDAMAALYGGDRS